MTESRGERARETPDITIHDPDDVIGGVAGGESGERATGTPNIIYNLSSVLFHALQGGASYDTYVEDAEREGDEELAEFFRRVREEDRDRASEAQLLLAERTLTTPGTEGTALDDAATEGTAPGVAATEDSEPDLPPGTERSGGEGTATGVPTTEELAPGVAATEGSEPDVSPGTERPGGLPDTEPRAEGAPSGDPRREYAVTERYDEDLTPPRDAVPPDAPEPPGASSEAQAGGPPRTEPISAPPGPGDVPPRRVEEASPRTEGGPLAEEVPSGTPPQPPPGDVQRGTSPTEQERTGQPEREQEEDKGMIDKVKDALLGEEERGREETGRGDRR